MVVKMGIQGPGVSVGRTSAFAGITGTATANLRRHCVRALRLAPNLRIREPEILLKL